MIKVNIKSDILKETKTRINVGMHKKVDLEGQSEVLEEELYKLLKEFEKRIPNIWINALERVMLDGLEGCFDLKGEDEE